MEHKDDIGSGFRILNVILIECNFKRVPHISFETTKETEAKFDSAFETIENEIYVTLTLDYFSRFNNEIEISCHIIMAGVFEKFGENPVPVEDFGRINGPAILFPFIREQLASVSLKAGVGPILLPPINFVKKAEEEKELSK